MTVTLTAGVDLCVLCKVIALNVIIHYIRAVSLIRGVESDETHVVTLYVWVQPG